MSGVIEVVGGAYGEECSFPKSTIYRGSGFRAASVVSGLGNDTVLHTVLGPGLETEFLQIAKIKGIRLQVSKGDCDMWFRYRHPLAKPDIYPPLLKSTRVCGAIEANDALVFGMLEGRPSVHAGRVVYDPQDGHRAVPFHIDGSTADQLAILASWSEARAMTGKVVPEEIAECLLATESCVSVVIKCGPQGALVATPQIRRWIRPFPSERVWKIGSGDIFAGAYAHAWLSERMEPLDAAWFASRMVSEYVSTRQETFSAERLSAIRKDAAAAHVKTQEHSRHLPSGKIYIAGPFFSTQQKWMIDEARGALMDMGFNVFSPIHDVGLGRPREVAPADLYALENSALVFALLDGLDPGTLFEVGYARALDIPVVCVAESMDEKPLTMLIGSGCGITNDFATGIYTACWQLMGDV